MNILITSSRMPFALDEIRKFGRAGHRVYAADTFFAAPGSHSRYVTRHFEVTSPEANLPRYLAEIEALVRHYGIDLVVPCFEEVFYLSRHRQRLASWTNLFAAEFEVLARLHHKGTFHSLAEELGIATPPTVLVASPSEMRAAMQRMHRYMARPAWSRGGIQICANTGPLAGALAPEDCAPTAARPWIVQEYIDGTDLCSFSVAQHGRVVAHCSYVHPKEIEHSGGIVFESVADGEALACVERVVTATGYHGQISMDFRHGSQGLVALECNPRPTAGVHLMAQSVFVDAILGETNGGLSRVPAGVRRLYASALLRDAVLHPRELPADLAYLFSDADDIYAEPGDRLPALYQVLSYGHVLSYRFRRHDPGRPSTKLMAAYFDGICWNGQTI
jgi:predicted ATP-grasp superfamily ATP-dependent carboligase